MLGFGSGAESKRDIKGVMGLKDVSTIKWEALNKGLLNPFE